MSLLAIPEIVGVVVLGTVALHRVAGLAFALVASPALIAFLGASEGVVTVALARMMSALAKLSFTFQSFVLRQVWPMPVVSAVASIPTVVLPRALKPGLGEIVAGVCSLGAVAHPISKAQWTRALYSNTLAAGLSTGALAEPAGLGGPPSAAYAVARQWGESAKPNLQLTFFLGSIVSVAYRSPAASLDHGVVPVAPLAVVAGTICGHRLGLGAQIPASRGARVMLIVANGSHLRQSLGWSSSCCDRAVDDADLRFQQWSR